MFIIYYFLEIIKFNSKDQKNVDHISNCPLEKAL